MLESMQELFDDIADRVENIFVMTRIGMGSDEESEALGILLIDEATGNVIALEAGMDADGHGTITVRSFDRHLAPVMPSIVEAGDSVMINTR